MAQDGGNMPLDHEDDTNIDNDRLIHRDNDQYTGNDGSGYSPHELI